MESADIIQNAKSCPDCGGMFADVDAPVHKYMGGSPGCWAVFMEVVAREFQDPAYFAAHQLTVDAYAAQHPGDQTDRRAVQSFNIHLVSLCTVFEFGADADRARKALKTLANEHKGAFRPLSPPQFYEMTIKDVARAKSAREHGVIVRDWAKSVWLAWSSHHDIVRSYAGIAGLK